MFLGEIGNYLSHNNGLLARNLTTYSDVWFGLKVSLVAYVQSFVPRLESLKGENLDKYKDAAKQTFAKSHRINFRVSEKDFRGI